MDKKYAIITHCCCIRRIKPFRTYCYWKITPLGITCNSVSHRDASHHSIVDAAKWYIPFLIHDSLIHSSLTFECLTIKWQKVFYKSNISLITHNLCHESLQIILSPGPRAWPHHMSMGSSANKRSFEPQLRCLMLLRPWLIKIAYK